MIVDVFLLAVGQDLSEPAEMVALGLIEHRAGVVHDTRRKSFVRRFIVQNGDPQLHQVVAALGAPGRLRADWTAGKSSAINTAMMAITTRSSISVNAGGRANPASPGGGLQAGTNGHRSSWLDSWLSR